MKNIVIDVQNGLLAEGVIQVLRATGDFSPFRTVGRKKDNVIQECQALSADVLLSEVSYAAGTTIDSRVQEAKKLRSLMPQCKIVFLCDENSSSEIAREVVNAKKDGYIDAFFYSSVTGKYLAAALSAL